MTIKDDYIVELYLVWTIIWVSELSAEGAIIEIRVTSRIINKS